MTRWERLFDDLGPQRMPAVWKCPAPGSPLNAEDATTILTSARDSGAAQVRGSSGDVMVEDAHFHDVELWRRVRGFFRAWLGRTGMPAGGTSASLALTHDPATPLGVRRDDRDAFTWVVSGRARVFLWSSEAFDRDRATVLEGEPGDLLFWPSTCWHLTEPVGGPVITLSLGRSTRSVDDVVLEDAARFFDEGTTIDGLDRTADALVLDRHELQLLPEALRDATDRALQDLDDAIHRRWLARLSNSGLPPPQRCTTPAPSTTRVAVDPDHPILWAPSRGGFLVAGAGRTSFLADAPWLPALLAALDREAPATADELVAMLDDDGAWPQGWRARARETIAELCSFRALLPAT